MAAYLKVGEAETPGSQADSVLAGLTAAAATPTPVSTTAPAAVPATPVADEKRLAALRRRFLMKSSPAAPAAPAGSTPKPKPAERVDLRRADDKLASLLGEEPKEPKDRK